jgi:hypothetical protein
MVRMKHPFFDRPPRVKWNSLPTNGETFVELIRSEVMHGVFDDALLELNEPTSQEPSSPEMRVSKWFRALSAVNRECVEYLIKGVAHAVTFHLLAVLDGVSCIGGSAGDDGFELWFVDGAKRHRINDPDAEFLHDQLNALDDVELAPMNPSELTRFMRRNPEAFRRTRIDKWIQGDRFAVRVEVDAVIPDSDPSEPCFEPPVLRFFDHLQELADAGRIDELEKHGEVYVRRSA